MLDSMEIYLIAAAEILLTVSLLLLLLHFYKQYENALSSGSVFDSDDSAVQNKRIVRLRRRAKWVAVLSLMPAVLSADRLFPSGAITFAQFLGLTASLVVLLVLGYKASKLTFEELKRSKTSAKGLAALSVTSSFVVLIALAFWRLRVSPSFHKSLVEAIKKAIGV